MKSRATFPSGPLTNANKPLKSQAGFTLMEMVVAFGLLAFVSLFAAMGIQSMVNSRAQQSFVGGRNFVSQKIHNKVSNVALIAWSAANNTSVDSDGNDAAIRACVFGRQGAGDPQCQANNWIPFVLYESDNLSNPRPVSAPLRDPNNISRSNMNRIFYNRDTMEPCDPAQISASGTEASSKCSIGVLTRMRATCPNGNLTCDQAQAVEIGYVIRSFTRSETSGVASGVLDSLALRDISNKTTIESKSLSLFKAQDFTISNTALAGGCKDGEVSAGLDGYGNLICQNIQRICPPGTVTVGMDRYGRWINTTGSSGSLTGVNTVSCIPADCGTTPEGRRRIMTSLVDRSTGLVRPRCVDAPVNCNWTPGNYPRVLMDLTGGNPATAVCGELNVCIQNNLDGNALSARNLTSDWAINQTLNPTSGIRGGVNATCDAFECGPNMYMSNWTGPNGQNRCYSSVSPLPPSCPAGTDRSNAGGAHPSDSTCKCPGGQVWNSGTNSCQVPPTCPAGVYSATPLPGGSSFTINSGLTCYCPISFSQNGSGIASSNYSGCKCPQSTQYISTNDGQCKTCPTGSSLRTSSPTPAGGIVDGTDSRCACNNVNEKWNPSTSRCEVMYYNRWCARELSGNAFWTSAESYENRSGCLHEGNLYANGQVTNWGAGGTTLTCFSSNSSIDSTLCSSNVINPCSAGQFYQITCNSYTSAAKSATTIASGYPKILADLNEARSDAQGFINTTSLAANCSSTCIGSPLTSICQGGTSQKMDEIRNGSCAAAPAPSTHTPLPNGVSVDKTSYSGTGNRTATCPANLQPGEYCLHGLIGEPRLCNQNTGSIYGSFSCFCPAGSSPSGLGAALPAPNFNCKCSGSGESWNSATNSCSAPNVACYFHSYVCGNACESTGIQGYYPTDELPNGISGCGARPNCGGTEIRAILVGTPEAANCNSTPPTTTTTTQPTNGCSPPETGFASTLDGIPGPTNSSAGVKGTWTATESGRYSVRIEYRASWDDTPWVNCIGLSSYISNSGNSVVSKSFPSANSGCTTTSGSGVLKAADGYEEQATLEFNAVQGQTYTLHLPGAWAETPPPSTMTGDWSSAYVTMIGGCGPATPIKRWSAEVSLGTREETPGDYLGCTAERQKIARCAQSEVCHSAQPCITSVSPVVNGECTVKGRMCVAD